MPGNYVSAIRRLIVMTCVYTSFRRYDCGRASSWRPRLVINRCENSDLGCMGNAGQKNAFCQFKLRWTQQLASVPVSDL
jgi:hypothetical protein